MLTRRTPIPPDDKPPPLAKRTPVDEYDRCSECGTEEGQPCFDSNDKPLASVCVGRTLSSSGALDREARNRYKRKKARTGESNADPSVSTTRKKPVSQKTRPCKGCSVEVPLPRVWCHRRICRAAAAKEYREIRSTIGVTIYKMVCNNCHRAYETTSASASWSTDPHCLHPQCRAAYRQKRNARRKKAPNAD
jgi:hypothetical protein